MRRRDFLKRAGLTTATLASGPGLISLLEACGGAAPSAPASAAPSFKGTLDFWVFGYTPGGQTVTGKNFDAAVAGFQKRNPDIQVKITGVPFDDSGLQKVDSTLAAHAGGLDIFRIASDALAKYTSQGLIQPIDDYLTADDRKDVFQNALDGVLYKGKHYAFPEWIPPVGIILNKAVFDEKGIAIPQDSWTVDQFMELAKKLTFTRSNGDKVYAYTSIVNTATINLFTWMYGDGATILNKDATKYTFNSPQAIKGLQHVLDLVAAKSTPPDFGSHKDQDIQTLFQKGLVAMYSDASGAVANWASKKVEIVVVPPPIGGAGKNVTVGGLATFPVIKQSDKARMATAMKLAKYVTGPEVLQDVPGWYLAPATRKSVKLPANPGMDRFQSMIPYTQLMPSIPQWGQIQQLVEPNLQLAVTGKKTASAALGEPADQVNSLLKT